MFSQLFKLNYYTNDRRMFYSGMRSMELSWQQTNTCLSWTKKKTNCDRENKKNMKFYSVFNSLHSRSSEHGEGATTMWSAVNGSSRMFVRLLTRVAEQYVPLVTKTNGISLLHSVLFQKRKDTFNEGLYLLYGKFYLNRSITWIALLDHS